MAAPRVLPSVLVAALGLSQVSAVKARLQCTFSSTEVISSAASVTWKFEAEGTPTVVWFFYYSRGKAYPGKGMPFGDRFNWAGDLNKRDASINITNIQFRDSGTYLCYVTNPPDTVVTPGAIRLRVVERDSVDHDYSIRNILGLAVAGVILLLLVFIVVTDHLFWKEERHKMLKPLANMENKVSY